MRVLNIFLKVFGNNFFSTEILFCNSVANKIKYIFSIMDFVVYRLCRPWLHFDFMLHFSSAGRNHINDFKDLHAVVRQVCGFFLFQL